MEPYLKDGSVIVPDRAEASTLMNKGCYGKPMKGGALVLTMLEAAYLVEAGRLSVADGSKGKIVHHRSLLSLGIGSEPKFIERYMVFRDLRNRGLLAVQDSEGSYMVYPRGSGPGKGKAESICSVRTESDTETPKGLWLSSRRLNGMGLGFISAIVDGDHDVTYYGVCESLSESMKSPPERSGPAPKRMEMVDIPGGGTLIGPLDKAVQSLPEHLGTRLPDSLLLSTLEARVLRRNLGKRPEQGPGPAIEEVYDDLSAKGFTVKTGFKYGTHFRVYTKPIMGSHSDLLVHVVDGDETLTWEWLSRATRLSHSVRKNMLVAFVPREAPRSFPDREGPIYLKVEWVRP